MGSGGQRRALAVIDIDGVVADVRHRLHHLERRPRRWPEFFAAADDDPALAVGVALVHELAVTYDVAWFTGRHERLRRLTEAWLAGHGLPEGPMAMRADKDFRPAPVVKPELLATLRDIAPVALVVDDDPDVLAVIARDGTPVRLADWVPRSATLARAQDVDGQT
jgi:hypothetical protein